MCPLSGLEISAFNAIFLRGAFNYIQKIYQYIRDLLIAICRPIFYLLEDAIGVGVVYQRQSTETKITLKIKKSSGSLLSLKS